MCAQMREDRYHVGSLSEDRRVELGAHVWQQVGGMGEHKLGGQSDNGLRGGVSGLNIRERSGRRERRGGQNGWPSNERIVVVILCELGKRPHNSWQEE